MFYNIFLSDAAFASLFPSKSMFANVNFCNLPRDAGYWMGIMGITRIMETMHYSYCSHIPIVPIISTVLIKKSFTHHNAAVRKISCRGLCVVNF